MPQNFGPVYEVTHTVDREVIADFDSWLGQHIDEMLTIDGIVRAASFSTDDDDDGRPRRVSRYDFDTDTDLENYLAGPAAVMRLSAEEKFAGRFDVVRRVLHENQVVDGSLKPAETCLNCGTSLTGQYCGNCGQRALSRLISIWQLLREAFGDLLELDSRVWRTLIPLAIRPGRLTRDYLQGRRARFMPPFRTYLVLSIVFFLVAFFDPREKFSIFFNEEADVAEESAKRADDAQRIQDEVMRELVSDGVLTAEQAGIEPPVDDPVVADEETPEPDAATDDDDDAFNIRFNNGETTTTNNCDEIENEDWPPWFKSRFTPERMKIMCERIVADDGKTWLGNLLDSVPAALIALLPLMALVLKMLYPLSKRYYVEHLLFVVHYHAFFFLILSLQILFSRLVSLLGQSGFVTGISIFAVSLYIPIYLAIAMRRFTSNTGS
jgi:hypothetical protein